VSEETYDCNELRYFIRFFGNPHLFQNEDEACDVLKTFPLYNRDMRRECRPDLFLHEYRKPISNSEFQFAVLHDSNTVPCVVLLDTLQQLDERSTSSDVMAGSFEKNAAFLEALSIEMLNRGITKLNGTVFIEPKHLELLPRGS
jgi:hypothetical protein